MMGILSTDISERLTCTRSLLLFSSKRIIDFVPKSSSKCFNREFKKPRQQRRGQRRLKINLYFTYESRGTLKSSTLFISVKTITN